MPLPDPLPLPLASRSKRSLRAGSAERCAGKILIATSRPSRVSPRWDTPLPSRPRPAAIESRTDQVCTRSRNTARSKFIKSAVGSTIGVEPTGYRQACANLHARSGAFPSTNLPRIMKTMPGKA